MTALEPFLTLFGTKNNMKTFSFIALGCKVNQYEIRSIAAQLQAYGLRPVAFGERADLCVINTCCVTGESEAKSRKVISRAHRTSPDAWIVITGCYAQIADTLPQHVDLLVPNSDKDRCVEKIVEFLAQNGIQLHKEEETHYQPLLHDRTRATVKVQDGCDSFCSYCIIPYARGQLSSKPIHEVEAEVRQLVACGFKEVVLTGIHLTRYGVDRGGESDLTDLILRINEIDGLERIRLGSLEPGFLNEMTIARLSQAKKLCGHFHLSLQSGCEATLVRMNRKYTPMQYAQEISLLRQYFPNCAITTDVMTGFSGETEEEFAQSLAFVRECGFAKVHVFTYSVRPGTAAAAWEQVPESIRHQRCRQMMEVAQAGREEYLRQAVGQTCLVLLEGKQGDWIHGFTENYIPVSIPSSQGMPNELIQVCITGIDGDGCKGVSVEG